MLELEVSLSKSEKPSLDIPVFAIPRAEHRPVARAGHRVA
jgi:hypothetical protein